MVTSILLALFSGFWFSSVSDTNRIVIIICNIFNATIVGCYLLTWGMVTPLGRILHAKAFYFVTLLMWMGEAAFDFVALSLTAGTADNGQWLYALDLIHIVFSFFMLTLHQVSIDPALHRTQHHEPIASISDHSIPSITLIAVE